MGNPQDFKSMQDSIQAALIETTRTVGQISNEDLGFQRSLNPDVGVALDEQSARLLALSTSLIKSAASIADLRVPDLQDVDDVDNDWRAVVDVVDSLLEKADTCLDEYTGVIKRQNPSVADQAPSVAKKQHPSQLGRSFRTQNLVKPQLAFKNKPFNDDTVVWKPILKTKPHAKKSLEESLAVYTDENQHQQYPHPYETEITELQYPQSVYEKRDPIPYQPIETTSATFVDTPEAVQEMLAELKQAKEIAVDLEHHDARSYVGLVSLMQISTRDKDWIVDTLKPWREDLQVLNEVFADPSIVKVFHGAFMDIVWLQRDLGLYIVGLFDTHHASRKLGYPGGSLAYLLKRFIDFDADKKYQMADWRIRPIPEEMYYYARADTHYLLYIYDMMRNELIERSDLKKPEENRIELVLEKSKEVSLLRYEAQIYDYETGKGPGGWLNLLLKTPALLSNEQFAVFKAVHAWRDRIARQDDDSINFVMPNHAIFNIAKLLPTDMVSLLGTVHPISHSVKSRSGELLALIKKAIEDGKTGPSMMEILRPDSAGTITKANMSTSEEESLVPKHYGDEKVVPRSNVSRFWGSAFGSSIWDPPTISTKDMESLRLAIPLPQLTSDIFATPQSTLADRTHDISNAVQDTPSKAPPVAPIEDDTFVIKSGRKRKSEEVDEDEEMPEATGEYDISLNEEAEQRAREKAARRAERKAQKKMKQAEAEVAAQSGSGMDNDEEEPFDYSKAESVLHGKGKPTDQSGLKRQKPFNPYAKSMDAPKGMRRLQTEKAGKSFTFKR